MNTHISPELINELQELEDEDRDRVLTYVRALKKDGSLGKRRAELMKLAGSIPKDQIEQIRTTIEQEFGQIEHDRW